jgi:hypothetical protein
MARKIIGVVVLLLAFGGFFAAYEVVTMRGSFDIRYVFRNPDSAIWAGAGVALLFIALALLFGGKKKT